MKPIKDIKLIQIEVTNACINQCANCTRFVGHHKTPFFMNLATISKAIDSLEGFPGNIGLMGGEPTLHPKFKEICELFQMKIPDKRRREFWTSGYKWEEYKDIIHETFDEDLISFNDHSSADGKHQPMLVAIDEILDDKEEMWNIIDKCWVQDRWCASITPKGAFFCEVAAAMDHMFDGPGGWKVEKDWWKRTPEDMMDQVSRYCDKCGATVPIGETSDNATFDIISPKNVQRLKELKSPKVMKGDFAVYGRSWTADEIKKKQKEKWNPQNYRTFVGHDPKDGK